MKKILTLALCLVASTAVFAQTQVIAHRGFHATQNSVRNSLSALKHAQDLGAYGSECDINETKDGVLVVVHGPMHGEYRQLTPNRITYCKKNEEDKNEEAQWWATWEMQN